MQFFTVVSYTLRQFGLDKHVDILAARREIEFSALEVLKDAPQPFGDALPFLFGQDALRLQHRRVRERAFDILFIHPLVEAQRRIEIVRRFI